MPLSALGRIDEGRELAEHIGKVAVEHPSSDFGGQALGWRARYRLVSGDVEGAVADAGLALPRMIGTENARGRADFLQWAEMVGLSASLAE